MKTYICFLTAAIMLTAASCRKDLAFSEPDFEVSVAQDQYQVGDTVEFIFKGNPDYLTFFSGESGNNYANRERTSVTGTPKISFTSFAQYGTQQNSLSLLVSTDFNGKVDADIAQATWTDITAQAKLSTGADNTPSGEIDLSPFADGDRTVYVAFRYIGTQSATSAQKTWTIKNFQLYTETAGGEKVYSVNAIPAAGFTAVSIKNDEKKWTQNATQLQMAGGGANTPDNEDWIVAALIPNRVSPDWGVGIKDVTGTLNTYRYVLQQPGDREVVFVASNANVTGAKSVVRKINIRVSQ
ncbi:DUF5017 domain-containing protein [Chitinophaga sp.]|uniref:DUF5017 domain-containing protein n=1 Tax=Chitinophaga sp. TaxID=1869181 RepID=UPI0031D2AE59